MRDNLKKKTSKYKWKFEPSCLFDESDELLEKCELYRLMIRTLVYISWGSLQPTPILFDGSSA